MKRRILALFACLLMTVSLLGAIPAQASQAKEDAIVKQITKTYKEARKKPYWKSSFDGYCGAYVHRQIFVLGITEECAGANGNDSYDLYKNKKKTTGNYEISAYPATKYTIKTALKAITENGRRDATNIMVGFQVGMSSAGQKYGHVVFLHAVMGETVYYSESFTTVVDGVTRKEGEPIVCSIDTFATYYASCRFEGIIHFEKAHKHTYDEKGYCTVCGKKNTDPKVAPVITQQPTGAAAGEGKTARVKVKAEGEGLKYTWYFKNAGDKEFRKTDTYKTATYSLKMNSSNSGRQVYCVVTDKKGKTVQTDVATLSALTITQQPSGATAGSGKTVKTALKATGTGLTYQWYIKSAKGSKFSKSSVKSATYSCKMSDSNSGRQVYCVITDAYGNSLQTETATLSLLTITAQPKSVTVANGKTAKTKVTASGTGLTYKWYIKSAKGSKYSLSSIKTAAYSVKMTASRAGRMVYCVITDKYGNSVQSNVAVLGKK